MRDEDHDEESLNILDGEATPLEMDDAEPLGGSFEPAKPEAIGDGDFDVLA